MSRIINVRKFTSADGATYWDVELFYTGTHTDGNGETNVWTVADLYNIVRNYTKRKDRAPVVLGHPDDIGASPKFGIIEKVWIEGARSLWGRLTNLSQVFIDWIKQGFYEERSLAILKYDNGDLDIEHIGFLGASSPALSELQKGSLPIPQYGTFKRKKGAKPYVYTHTSKRVFNMEEQLQIMQDQIDRMVGAINEIAKAVGVDVGLEETADPGQETPETDSEMSEEDEEDDDESSDHSASDEEDEEDDDEDESDHAANEEGQVQLAPNPHKRKKGKIMNHAERRISELENELRLNKFKSFINTPKVRCRLNGEQRKAFLNQFRSMSPHLDWSKGEPKLIKDMKATILSLDEKVSLTKNFASGGRAVNGFKGKRSPEAEAREILSR